jgi:hypothetical protein
MEGRKKVHPVPVYLVILNVWVALLSETLLVKILPLDDAVPVQDPY